MARRSSGFGHTNPVFDRNPAFAGRGGAPVPTPSVSDLEGMYGRPPASSAQMQRMTLDDVVMKSAACFGLLILVAATTYFVLPDNATFAVLLPGMIVGLVLGLIIAFKQSTNPALILSYAVAQGFFVGGISNVYGNAFGDGIVTQAVLGTLCAVVGMLVLYSTRVLRATPKFTKVLISAALGYFALAVVSLVSSFFGVGDGWGFYGLGGGLGILLSVAGVALASLFLVLDFDFIERGAAGDAPSYMEWYAAFGLLVTLVWLYLEILRLLGKARR